MYAIDSDSFSDIILYILAIILIIIWLGCVYAFFRAIFLFIFSKGDEKQIKSAWSSIRYMIIGLFLTIMLLFVGPTILRYTGLQGAENYKVANIFTTVGKIFRQIGSLGNIIKESQLDNQYRGLPFQDTDVALPSASSNADLENYYWL